jgi:outer membrane lipoprotein-sorting protein
MSLKRRFFLGAAAVLAFFSFCMEPALASQAETKEQVLARLDSAAANFHSTSADVEFDTIETEPVPDTDVQKGVVYYERKNNAVRMGVHLSEHDGHPTAKAYTFIGSTFELFEPGINQVTKYVKAGKWEGYVSLGMGASGKDLAAKWDIQYLGPELMNGVNTDKLELVPKDPEVRKSITKVDIWVDPEHAVSLKQVFTLSGTSSYVGKYSNFKFNTSLPGDAFTFKTDKKTVTRTQ